MTQDQDIQKLRSQVAAMEELLESSQKIIEKLKRDMKELRQLRQPFKMPMVTKGLSR